MSDFERPFYTIPEAARRKEIEHYKIGKQIRISAAELERLKVPAEPKAESKEENQSN